MPSPDAIEWGILDALSDDYEELSEIAGRLEQNGETTATVPETLSRLIDSGLVVVRGDDPVVYGITPDGGQRWEILASRFSTLPVDWSDAWTVDLDYQAQTGVINGATRAACEAAVQKLFWLPPGIEVDTGTLVFEPIEGFWAKYWKWIDGGQRLTFLLRNT